MLINFSKNTVVYCFLRNKKLFGLILSCFKGWNVMRLKPSYFLIKKQEFYPIVLKNKSYFSFLSTLFLGFQKGYFKYLKLRGMGYKFTHFQNSIILKFDFSHRVIYSNYVNVYCLFINRYLIRLESRSFWDIKIITYFFNSIRKNNVYKKKGIFLKGSLIDIKVSSKKSKF